MKRLTHIDHIGWYVDDQGAAFDERRRGKYVDRLALYEDCMERWKMTRIEEVDRVLQRVNTPGGTDLMAQYRGMESSEHIREILQAEKDGRLVVLPCKVGDTVFLLNPERTCIVQIRVQGLSISPTGRIVLHFGGCPPEYAWGDGCGKEWFLTREEAEADLKKREADNEAD